LEGRKSGKAREKLGKDGACFFDMFFTCNMLRDVSVCAILPLAFCNVLFFACIDLNVIFFARPSAEKKMFQGLLIKLLLFYDRNLFVIKDQIL